MINLFTVPQQPAPSPDGSSSVVSAIKAGSGASGTDFDYLLKTAGRESALDPAAKSETSSASGLFQFIDQTWLRMVKLYGSSIGLGNAAEAIVEDRPGHYDVNDPAQRRSILDLRHDPKIASSLAGFFSRDNARELSSALHRKVSMEELYIAHVLGASGAADLISLAESDPDKPAAPLFADAARANPALFFDRAKDQPKSLADLRDGLANAYRKSSVDFAAIAQIDDGVIEVPVEIKPDQSKTLYSLFQNRSDTAPLNPYIRDLWQSPDATSAPLQPSYFPRSAMAPNAYGVNALPPLPDTRVNVPLPPRRLAPLTSP